MDKQAFVVRVSTTSDGNIEISQQEGHEEEAERIRISPDQVDMLIAWLNEAKNEIDNA